MPRTNPILALIDQRIETTQRSLSVANADLAARIAGLEGELNTLLGLRAEGQKLAAKRRKTSPEPAKEA